MCEHKIETFYHGIYCNNLEEDRVSCPCSALDDRVPEIEEKAKECVREEREREID